MILKAPAKLNLYLEVLRLRKDNYHDIKTLFSRINLCDTIFLRKIKENEIKIVCKGLHLPLDKNNLCFKTAKILKDYCRIKEGIEIKIIKRIPIGSGLGGGSSNAASLLLGLNSFWNLNLSKKELIDLAKLIGSDVLFFLYNYSFALGMGRPDYLKPVKELDKTKLWYVLIVPSKRVSSSFIYREFDRLNGFRLTKPKFDVNILIWGLKEKDSVLTNAGLFNHLEVITERIYPKIHRIKKEFYNLGVKSVSMSGKGLCIFGIFFKRKEAEAVCSYLKNNLNSKSLKVYLTESI